MGGIMASEKKCVKVPVILQMEELECGAASLAMVLAYYKKWVPLEQVRTACGVSRDGCSAWNVLEAAKEYGLKGKGFRYSLKYLREKASFPKVFTFTLSDAVRTGTGTLSNTGREQALSHESAGCRIAASLALIVMSFGR